MKMALADVTSAVTPALSLGAITVLLAALGLSSTAGLRAYLPLLAVGIAGGVPGPFAGKLIPLQSSFQVLSDPIVLIILALLTVGEFTIDKLPVVDHLSDAVHTVIRPLAGAMIMAGTQNSLSLTSPWAAAALGGVLALGFHGVKATTRPAVTATTAGLGNPIVSFIEDILVVVMVLLLVLAPIVGIVLMAALVVVIGRLLLRIMRRFRGRKAGKQANQAVVVSAAPAPRRGKGKRGQAAPSAAPPPRIAAPVVAGPVAAANPPMPNPVAPTAALPNPPMAPAGTTSATATTLAATHQAPPYVPPPAPTNPPVWPPQGPVMPPQPTQTLPGQSPSPYPDDATTLPGTYNGSNP